MHSRSKELLLRLVMWPRLGWENRKEWKLKTWKN